MRTITEPARDIKVENEVDICVIGGSCTGVFAAVRAARLGAKVAIIEKQNCFGGTATLSMVNVWHSLNNISGTNQIIAGLTLETLERLKNKGGCAKYKSDANTAYNLDTEILKHELDCMILENSIKPYLHTMYCSPYIKDGNLLGIVIENKNGRQAILAKFFIDASGDGDLAHDLGIDNYTYDSTQPPTSTYKLIGETSNINIPMLLQEHGKEFGLPEDWGWGGPIPSIPNLSFRADTHVFGVDCSNADDLTLAEIEGRKQINAIIQILEKYAQQKDNAIRVVATCSSIGIRQTRHFGSEYKISQHDLLYGVRYDDAIANGTYRIDIHHSNGAGITFRSLDGHELIYTDRTKPPKHNMWRTDNNYAEFYQIPFKTLVQKKYSNVITAGRMINADNDAFGAVRVMVNLNQVGEAAGVAGYIAITTGKEIWNIDTRLLRSTLKKGGSIIL